MTTPLSQWINFLICLNSMKKIFVGAETTNYEKKNHNSGNKFGLFRLSVRHTLLKIKQWYWTDLGNAYKHLTESINQPNRRKMTYRKMTTFSIWSPYSSSPMPDSFRTLHDSLYMAAATLYPPA